MHEEVDEGGNRSDVVLAPVLIDDILPPFGFRSIQAAKLAGWNGKAPSADFDRLLAELAHILGTTPVKVKEEQQRQAGEEAWRKVKEKNYTNRKKMPPDVRLLKQPHLRLYSLPSNLSTDKHISL